MLLGAATEVYTPMPSSMLPTSPSWLRRITLTLASLKLAPSKQTRPRLKSPTSSISYLMTLSSSEWPSSLALSPLESPLRAKSFNSTREVSSLDLSAVQRFTQLTVQLLSLDSDTTSILIWITGSSRTLGAPPGVTLASLGSLYRRTVLESAISKPRPLSSSPTEKEI